MSTTTMDEPITDETADQAQESMTKKPNRPQPKVASSGEKKPWTAKLRSAGGPAIRIAGIRLGTIIIDWLLVMLTAAAVLPTLGAWLHQESGAQGLNLDGTVAFWLVPYLFVVGMIMVAEVAFMKWLWQAGTRRIARHHDPEPEPTPPQQEKTAKATKTTTGGRKKNRNRKRRTK